MTHTPAELKQMFKNDVEKYKDIINFPIKNKNQIRIMTFNVHNWTNYIGAKSMDNIFKLILQSNADIIGINEGLYFTKGSKAKILEYSQLLKYKYLLECNNRYGINLILSKYPIVSHEIICLGKDPIHNENRYAIKATIKIDDNLLNVLVTHLDVWDETESTRLKQMELIFEKIDESYLLLGDFNSLRKKDYTKTEWNDLKTDAIFRGLKIQHKVTSFIESNKFTDCFVKLNKPCPKISVWSMRRVDYIYIGNKFNHELIDCKICPTIVSDHYPIFVDVLLKNKIEQL